MCMLRCGVHGVAHLDEQLELVLDADEQMEVLVPPRLQVGAARRGAPHNVGVPARERELAVGVRNAEDLLVAQLGSLLRAGAG